ncbi:MAG TPA: ABC transporter ATP-binding protein [Acidobacteriaceae bacterium]|nr:ABC transporter ATP-binding protein [Acidobacteriaceae bacterium]
MIRTEGLRKSFGRTEVLRGIELAVPEGSIYALVGANGAGKTTMIKVLMNILRPSGGRSEVLGWDSGALTGERFCEIGYVSENQELPDAMKVGEMLDYVRAFYPRWDCALERELVRQFDLPLDRRLKHLSRGMRMKAAFASSMAYRPKLMVLDEPLAGLDPLVRDELIEGILERATETTIFLSSHDLSEIESFASHVGYMEDGRVLFSDEMGALGERFREVTITMDGTARLPDEMPPGWLLGEAGDAVLRFVHSAYRGEASGRELRERFPAARSIEAEPMPLRAIFLAMAKSGRRQRKMQPPQSSEKEKVKA